MASGSSRRIGTIFVTHAQRRPPDIVAGATSAALTPAAPTRCQNRPDDRCGDGFDERLADDVARRRDPGTVRGALRGAWYRRTAPRTPCSSTPPPLAGRGLTCIIAGAGGAAHFRACWPPRPLCRYSAYRLCPSTSPASTLCTRSSRCPGVPVATFAIGEAGATDAGLFAVALLAMGDDVLRDRLEAYRAELAAGVAAATSHQPVSGLVIEPPAMLGVLGGGQLGRYFALAAAPWVRRLVLEPDPDAPAGVVADHHLVAEYDDRDALDELARSCAAVTVEFENPPAAALERLAADVVVAPAPDAIAIAQDRRNERRSLSPPVCRRTAR